MHASNPNRNEEETWFLWEVDAANHIYALQNWRNGNFLSAKGNGCARADVNVLTKAEEWIFIKGAPYGALNAIALRSVWSNNLLGANRPGDDTNCGGEVGCGRPEGPPNNEGTWAGWWVPEAATPPSPGQNFWNTAGNFFLGIAVNLAPVAIAALIAAL
jgi:hypothetical protein